MTSSSKSKNSDRSSEKNISSWIKRETFAIKNALETASKHFDVEDALDVHTLQAVYAKESSFGQTRGKQNSSNAAGDFQIKKSTAKEIGLRVDETIDERFDVNQASVAAAKLLKRSDYRFEKPTKLYENLNTIAIKDPEERKKIALAAYNAGDSRIAKAQKIAKENGEDPTKWAVVQNHLEEAGATRRQAEETRDYVKKITGFESEFKKRSKTSSNVKIDKNTGGHWVTIHGRHILIKDK